VPIMLFIAYMIFFPPQFSAGTSWKNTLDQVLGEKLLDGFVISHVVSLMVLNFNWLLSVVVLAVFLLGLKHRTKGLNTKNAGFKRPLERIFFYVFFLLSLFLLTRIKNFNFPRYMLLILPIFIVIFTDSFLRLFKKNRTLRIVYLTLALILIYLSSFRTLDPVSKTVYGTFRFGSHDLLNMRRYDEPRPYYGCNEIVYNYEFTQLLFLTNRIVRSFGLDKPYAAGPSISFLDFVDFCSFDKKSIQKSNRTHDKIDIRFNTFDRIQFEKIDDFYFIEYPNLLDNQPSLNQAGESFVLKEKILMENQGYVIPVWHFVSKQTNIG
jgi:hypothetical protein